MTCRLRYVIWASSSTVLQFPMYVVVGRGDEVVIHLDRDGYRSIMGIETQSTRVCLRFEHGGSAPISKMARDARLARCFRRVACGEEAPAVVEEAEPSDRAKEMMARRP